MKIRDLKYLLAYLLPFSAYIALEIQNYWSFSTVILAFVLIPILEIVMPPNSMNMGKERESGILANNLFDYLLYLNIPIVYFLIFRTLFIVQGDLQWFEILGFMLNLGIVLATAGINVAHELGHRSGMLNKLAASSLLLPSLYGHFTIEHNNGHHKWVATPEDPATAKFGQSIYSFLRQAVIGVYLKAWEIAFMQMKRERKPKFHYSNELIWITIAQIVLFVIFFSLGGFRALLFCLGSAFVGFMLLESIDYVEHYGLQRRKLDSGMYERVNENHSWNSDHEVGRILLYELTRHTDHHMNANRKYQVLRHMDDSPQLPYGYPASILLALVPPFWFRIMNPKVKAINS